MKKTRSKRFSIAGCTVALTTPDGAASNRSQTLARIGLRTSF